MSILIKGMELPDLGNETIIRIQPDGSILDQYGHHLDCAAIPVPPHGRLGDLDALAKQCDDPYWCVWLSDIEAAPTIIEAEEG